ncbi:MAG: hypothetical protein FJ395_21150 [Verrucomicrobia bacterium]|nr:hypothetical protein [Verrucomicrobiota bacterium]
MRTFLLFLFFVAASWAELPSNLDGLRDSQAAKLRELTQQWEARIPPEARKTVKLADGRTAQVVDTSHPGYQEVKAKWQAELNNTRTQMNTLDSRTVEADTVIKDLGKGKKMFHTGTPRPEGNLPSDVDLTGDYDSCKEFMDKLKKRNPKIEFVEKPGRWEIVGQDMNIYCEQAGGGISLEQKLMQGSDFMATDGAVHNVSKGKAGVYDGEGVALGHGQKFTESGITAGPDGADLQKASKSVKKLAEFAGTAEQNPGFFEKAGKMHARLTPEEAGVVTFGNPEEVKAFERAEYCDTAKKEFAKAHKEAVKLSDESNAVRDRRIAEYESKPSLTPDESLELETLRTERAKIARCNQAGRQEMVSRDPAYYAEVAEGGVRLQKVVAPDGTVRFKTPGGELLTQSEATELVLQNYRPTTMQKFRAATGEFFGAPPPGARATCVKGANVLMLLYMAYEGYHRAMDEIDPYDSYTTSLTKTGGKTVWYASGIPAIYDTIWAATDESRQQFIADLEAGRDPSRYYAIGRGWAVGLGRLLKAMTVDPLYEGGVAIDAGAGVLWHKWGASSNAKEAAEKQVLVANYRTQTLDQAEKRLKDFLATTEDPQLIQYAQEGLKKIEAARKAQGNLDQRLLAYRQALEWTDELTRQTVPRPIQAGTDTIVDVNLPPMPTGNRLAIIQWRDNCLADLQKAMDNDSERVANRKAALSLGGKPRKLTCKKCGFGEEHWWFDDRWSCPKCETCTMPSELKRRDGLTYGEFAQQRMKRYQDKMEQVRLAADKALR